MDYCFVYLCLLCLSCIVDGVKIGVFEAFHNFEVIEPQIFHNRQKRDTTATQDGHLGKLSMVLSTAKRKITIDLEQTQDLVPSNFVVRTFREDGSEIIQHPNYKKGDNCHYHGYVRGHNSSIVALSTCHGVSGLISDDEVFYIHPLEESDQGLSSKHGFFREQDRIHNNFTCGNKDKHHPHRHKRSAKDWYPNLKDMKIHWPWQDGEKTKIVELYTVLDHEQYVELEKNTKMAVERTKDTINIVSALWSQLGIQVVLVGMEIWTDRDKMQVHESAEKTISEFVNYRQRQINQKFPNDNAQFITGQHFKDGIVGKALTGSICTFKWSGGVNMDNYALLGPIATTIAHELGHNMGMSHDSFECQCPEDRCVMAASSGQKSPNHWSSCSKEDLADTFHSGQDYCLRNLPEATYKGPVCGNGFLEEGEDCDCGVEQFCETPCCNASTCRLTVNSTCATGPCCDMETCQLKPGGVSCRDKTGYCDLPEFCTGESEFCPDDVYVYDGHECQVGNDLSYCYKGECKSYNSQCQFLWGHTGRMASKMCYKDFNIYGTGHGNCGYNWVHNTYKKCAPEDVMCGMLFCEHRAEKLAFWKNSLVNTMPHFYTYENGTKVYCKGAILDVGLNDHDPGMVQDGVKCADGKVCQNQRCRPVGDPNLVKGGCGECNKQGICNSKGACHCAPGFAPPFCDRPGNGGSIHSGPYPPYKPAVNVLILAMVLTTILIIIIIAVMFLLYKNKALVMKHLARLKKPKIKYRDNSRNEISRAPVKRQTSFTAPPPPKQNSLQRNSLPRNTSFRGVDISKPVLQDTTNTMSTTGMTDVTYGGPMRPKQPSALAKSGSAPARPPPPHLAVAPIPMKIISPPPAYEPPEVVKEEKKLVPTRPAPAAPPSDNPSHNETPSAVPMANGSVKPLPVYKNIPYAEKNLEEATSPTSSTNESFQRPVRPVRPSRSMRVESSDNQPPKMVPLKPHATVTAADIKKPEITKRSSIINNTNNSTSDASKPPSVAKNQSMTFKDLQAKFSKDLQMKPVGTRTPTQPKPVLPRKPGDSNC